MIAGEVTLQVDRTLATSLPMNAVESKKTMRMHAWESSFFLLSTRHSVSASLRGF